VENGVLLPAWLVMPVAAFAMIVVAAHIEVTSAVTEPRSRRRIRLANGWVMLITVPLLASGFSLLNPDSAPRAFALVWTVCVGFVFVSLCLAGMDILNTLRLAARARRRLRQTLSNLTREIEFIAREGRAGADGTTDEAAAG